MTEQEQNKKINQHQRLINTLREKLKTIELDVEPSGRILTAFEAIENDLDEIKSRTTKLEQRTEHRFNRLDAKLEIILKHLTSINDLPEELSDPLKVEDGIDNEPTIRFC